MRGNRFSNLSNDVFRAFKSGNIVEPLALFSVGYDRAIMKKERGKERRGEGRHAISWPCEPVRGRARQGMKLP